ncbi:hypothetical protein DPMN_048066 [Dreissena polymorpha]|uniref:Uncharacterized protein n=1 Tax=Dreissena polymorpha TaxID=45954 RepID=A0A9D4DAW8_DREPO|nr:hypothetical protein DPMN_048066 [Dreissena polymorpha]
MRHQCQNTFVFHVIDIGQFPCNAEISHHFQEVWKISKIQCLLAGILANLIFAMMILLSGVRFALESPKISLYLDVKRCAMGHLLELPIYFKMCANWLGFVDLPSGFNRDSSHTCSYGEKAKLPNHECVKIIMVYDRINTENSSSLTADYISLCDTLIGWFEYDNWSYTINNGPVLMARNEHAAHMEILVSKTERQRTASEVDGLRDRAHIRARRETTQNVTIETVLILDELYIAKMAEAGYSSDAQLTKLMQLKWSGVQAEWGKANVLGYKVVLEIKQIVFWRKNPEYCSVWLSHYN